MLVLSTGNVAFYLLGVWGISYVLSIAKIGHPIRVAAALLGDGFLDFIRCPACTGWWAGSLVGWAVCQEIWGSGRFATYGLALFGGFACCGFNRIVYGFFFGEPLDTEQSDGGNHDRAS